MSQSVTECYRVIQSVTERYRVLQSVTECYRVLQSITEYYRVLQSITKTNLAHLLGPFFGLVRKKEPKMAETSIKLRRVWHINVKVFSLVMFVTRIKSEWGQLQSFIKIPAADHHK